MFKDDYGFAEKNEEPDEYAEVLQVKKKKSSFVSQKPAH